MQMPIHEAKRQLSRLIAAAGRGEEGIITRRGRPVVKLVAVEPAPRDRKRALGFLKGFMSEELVDFLTSHPSLDKEIEDDFYAWEREEPKPREEHR